MTPRSRTRSRSTPSAPGRNGGTFELPARFTPRRTTTRPAGSTKDRPTARSDEDPRSSARPVEPAASTRIAHAIHDPGRRRIRRRPAARSTGPGRSSTGRSPRPEDSARAGWGGSSDPRGSGGRDPSRDIGLDSGGVGSSWARWDLSAGLGNRLRAVARNPAWPSPPLDDTDGVGRPAFGSFEGRFRCRAPPPQPSPTGGEGVRIQPSPPVGEGWVGGDLRITPDF